MTIDHLDSSVIVGDFTAKCSKWYLFHKNNAAGEIMWELCNN